MRLCCNWLQVLGPAELAQIDQRARHQLHPRMVKKFKTSFAVGFITQLSTCVEPIFGGLSSLLQSWLSTSAPALAPLFLPGYIGAPQDLLSMDDSRHGPRPRHGDDAEKSRWHGNEERYPIS